MIFPSRPPMAVLASALIISLSTGASFAADRGNLPEVKNIIFLVVDGMGLANITAARIFRNGADGPPLHLETLERVGYQRTYSANSTITDSAAGASAWACGEKFKNGEVCFHGDGRPPFPSLLELAKTKGMGTGLVTTGVITDATPAAFGAHVVSRSCHTEIARQYIEVTAPDILLGGGASRFNPSTPDRCGTQGDYILTASKMGYTVLFNKTDLFEAVSGGTRKILGLFTAGGMTADHRRPPDCPEPRLPEMAAAALQRLENEPKGFFLMMEGSQVDAGNHRNNLLYQIGEILAFDETVKKVLDWVHAGEERKQQTLIVVTPDHETGGFAIHGPADRLGRPGEYILPGWTTTGHTGGDVVHWAQGPGSARLGKALNNTDIYWILRDLMQAPR